MIYLDQECERLLSKKNLRAISCLHCTEFHRYDPLPNEMSLLDNFEERMGFILYLYSLFDNLLLLILEGRQPGENNESEL